MFLKLAPENKIVLGCKSHRPYCHGRCVFAGRRCFFSVCSRSPYREEISETCAELVHELVETENENEGCMNSCADLSTEAGEATCQSCLVTNLPQECSEMSGASCFKCSIPVLQALEACSENNHDYLDIIQCIHGMQSSSCKDCTCTVLCQESPDSEHCKSCLQQPELEELFLHHQFCHQENNILCINSL